MQAEDALDASARVSVIRMLCAGGHRPRMAMRGTSMLPLLRAPMVLEVDRVVERPKFGQIIVFEQDDRLVAHRVVGISGSENILAAGDATPGSLEVVPPSRIVGNVARVWSSSEAGAGRVDDALFRARGALYACRWVVRARTRRMRAAIEGALRSANPRRRPRAFHVLYNALGAILQGDAPALLRHLASTDGRWLLETARRHQCAAILADGIEGLGVSDRLDPRLRSALWAERWSAALRVATLRRQVEEIVTLLGRHQLVPVLLKGAARVYTGEARCELHDSRDIDVLLRPDDIKEATRMLHDAGYQEQAGDSWADHHHGAPLVPPQSGVPVELHRALAPPGTLRLPTDALSLAPWIRSVEGAAGRVGVLDDVGSALHLAIHARGFTPLRDLVLLAERLRRMESADRQALYVLVDREGRERLRLHGMLHGAARLVGIAWPAPRGALRYFAWRLRRGDLPAPLRRRSRAVDELMAGGGCSIEPALRALLANRDRARRPRAARIVRFVAYAAARAVAAGCAACYALLMKCPDS